MCLFDCYTYILLNVYENEDVLLFFCFLYRNSNKDSVAMQSCMLWILQFIKALQVRICLSPYILCVLQCNSKSWYLYLYFLHRLSRSFLHLPLLNKVETIYIIGLVPVQLFYSLGLPILGLQEKLPFVPLMVFSVYCSFGVLYSYLRFYFNFICNRTSSLRLKYSWSFLWC